VNREFELVQLLDRTPEPPTRDEVTRQFAILTAAVELEIAARERAPRRRARTLVRSVVAATVVGGLGATGAYAWSQRGPDPQQAATVKRHSRSAVPVHRPGWRPELDAERVVCDYQGLGRATNVVYSYASAFPLAEPLTQSRLVDECRSGTDATTGNPVTGAATLCAVTPPGERLAVPVVTFGSAGCDTPGLSAAPNALLDERNRLRRAETAIRAVPQDCPTADQARTWVEEQVAGSGESLRLLPVESYPSGRCFLPFVHWGRGEVEIIATENTASPTNGTGTVPPPAPQTAGAPPSE
jgi:hypothetical protein